MTATKAVAFSLAVFIISSIWLPGQPSRIYGGEMHVRQRSFVAGGDMNAPQRSFAAGEDLLQPRIGSEKSRRDLLALVNQSERSSYFQKPAYSENGGGSDEPGSGSESSEGTGKEFPVNPDGTSYQITYGGIAHKYYTLFVLDSGENEAPTEVPTQIPEINEDTILFMDQTQADGTGMVIFDDFIPKTTFTWQYVYMSGAAGSGLSGLEYIGYLEKIGPTDISDRISFVSGTAIYNGQGQRHETAQIAGVSGGTWEYTYEKKGQQGSFDGGGFPQGAGTWCGEFDPKARQSGQSESGGSHLAACKRRSGGCHRILCHDFTPGRRSANGACSVRMGLRLPGGSRGVSCESNI